MQSDLQELLRLVTAECDLCESASEEALMLLELVLLSPSESILFEKNSDVTYDIPADEGRAWVAVKRVYRHTFFAIIRETKKYNRAVIFLDEMNSKD